MTYVPAVEDEGAPKVVLSEADWRKELMSEGQWARHQGQAVLNAV